MDARISVVTLGVQDLERSVKFYRDGLGFPQSTASDGDFAIFALKGTALALYPRSLLAKDAGLSDTGSGFGGFSLGHNVASREMVDDLLQKAVAAGAKIIRPAHAAEWGGYSGYFSDPDGYAWEVAWHPFFTFDSEGHLQLPI